MSDDRLDQFTTRRATGIAESSRAELNRLFDSTSGLTSVWVFGSRARGDYRPESDVDLAVDAPEMSGADFARLRRRLEELGLLYKVDLVRLQDPLDPGFLRQIEADKRLFWAPRRQAAAHEEIGNTQLKPFQTTTLLSLDTYLRELKRHKAQSEAAVVAIQAMEGMEELVREAADFPKKSWGALRAAGSLPPVFANLPHSSRFDGAGRAIPNVCLKIPTGGGKTLLAAASVGRVFSNYLARHTGLVLWIVPNEAIYQQTLKTLKNRDHPYRQMLNVAGAGQVKILEKNSPLSKIDTDSHLCVMLLMLASASRQSKETLRFFRDRGNVLGYTPREDDIEANWDLLQAVPNLDAYTS